MVILRHALRHVPCSRHALPHFHCGGGVQVPLGGQNSLPCWLIEKHEDCKVLDSSLNFHFSGIIVVSRGGNVPPFGAGTLV